MSSSIGSWNTWGINNPRKFRAISSWISSHQLEIIGLIETKLPLNKIASMEASLNLHGWQFISNASVSDSCRILLGWNPLSFRITCIHCNPQWITCEAFSLSTKTTKIITFVYAFNKPADRKPLWDYIANSSSVFSQAPWVLLGDFNAIMQPDQRAGGSSKWQGHEDDFQNAIHSGQLFSIPYKGMKFTWSNGQMGDRNIQKKLDWAFGNSCTLQQWPAVLATFLPRSTSDHSALVLDFKLPQKTKPSPFKFLNSWTEREDYMPTISEVWQQPVAGNPMFRLLSKMRRIKATLKSFHRKHSSHLSSRVHNAKLMWDQAQYNLDRDSGNDFLKIAEREAGAQFARLSLDEEAFFKQKSRVQWLQLGDKNTSFFHKSVMHRQARNRIHSITDDDGNTFLDQSIIGSKAAAFFEDLLNSPSSTNQMPNLSHLYPTLISDISFSMAGRSITREDIKDAMFSIPDGKAPGPDGFSALFFKQAWHIVGRDVSDAIIFFFETGSLPRCINATRIALVPKKESPDSFKDYRPISCCNVVYKCISKIIAGRLKQVLGEVVAPAQSAFLPDRQIADAILLAQELFHNYHLQAGPPRCAVKVDLQKAFDTVSWQFILEGLKAIGMPRCMIKWIEACITTPFFSVSVNGELNGFFSSSRGIRQGDPISPYLFVLAMEGLNGALKLAQNKEGFRYHWRCKKNTITNICFADDLLLFCHADERSCHILKSSLVSFSELSGLNINHAKSALFLSGVTPQVRQALSNIMGIQLQSPPIRYLGLPLITTRLTYVDCLPLINRITTRIRLWTSATLTYAGRLQLIKAVLFSIQVYWSTSLMLPAAVVKKIEGIMAAFLWSGVSLHSKSAKVAWQSLCFPINEGGLGIKRLSVWNQAAITKLIWRLLSKPSSIWSAWVSSNLLRGRSFWQINIPINPSWSWRKILQTREWCRGKMISFVGNGNNTFLWHDYWIPQGGCLRDLLSPRQIAASGLHWNAKVADIIENGAWKFPNTSSISQDIWRSIQISPQVNRSDGMVWTGKGSGKFTTDSAWALLRQSRPSSPSHCLPWLTGHIPRHSFILWMAMQCKLRTKDRLWFVDEQKLCVLCGLEEETHAHLFFQCRYSTATWEALNHVSGIGWSNLPWNDLINWAATNFPSKHNHDHIIARISMATAVYFIWYERNNRLFNQAFKSAASLVDDIIQLLRLHLSTIKLKTPLSDSIKARWGISGRDSQGPA